MNKNDLHDDNISKILNDSKKVTQIIQAGIKAALMKHKQAGNPVCEWRDNKIFGFRGANTHRNKKIIITGCHQRIICNLKHFL